jgi:hypothetical protein
MVRQLSLRWRQLQVEVLAFSSVLARDIEASGFEPVAIVLAAVLFAQVSGAVWTVLYRHDLAVVAYCAPYESHFSYCRSSFRH